MRKVADSNSVITAVPARLVPVVSFRGRGLAETDQSYGGADPGVVERAGVDGQGRDRGGRVEEQGREIGVVAVVLVVGMRGHVHDAAELGAGRVSGAAEEHLEIAREPGIDHAVRGREHEPRRDQRAGAARGQVLAAAHATRADGDHRGMPGVERAVDDGARRGRGLGLFEGAGGAERRGQAEHQRAEEGAVASHGQAGLLWERASVTSALSGREAGQMARTCRRLGLPPGTSRSRRRDVRSFRFDREVAAERPRVCRTEPRGRAGEMPDLPGESSRPRGGLSGRCGETLRSHKGDLGSVSRDVRRGREGREGLPRGRWTSAYWTVILPPMP